MRRPPGKPDRRSVDLSGFPDLVVVYLGLRVNTVTGLKAIFGIGPQIDKSVAAKPDGLLLHEPLMFSLFPPHIGMRQYWRDFESLEKWTRSDPHRAWWKQFIKDSGGNSVWHEAYSIRGGFEAVYLDLDHPFGLMKFAPVTVPKAGTFSSRERLKREGAASPGAPASESELYNS